MSDKQPLEVPALDDDENPDELVGEDVEPEHDLDITTFEVDEDDVEEEL